MRWYVGLSHFWSSLSLVSGIFRKYAGKFRNQLKISCPCGNYQLNISCPCGNHINIKELFQVLELLYRTQQSPPRGIAIFKSRLLDRCFMSLRHHSLNIRGFTTDFSFKTDSSTVCIDQTNQMWQFHTIFHSVICKDLQISALSDISIPISSPQNVNLVLAGCSDRQTASDRSDAAPSAVAFSGQARSPQTN